MRACQGRLTDNKEELQLLNVVKTAIDDKSTAKLVFDTGLFYRRWGQVCPHGDGAHQNILGKDMEDVTETNRGRRGWWRIPMELERDEKTLDPPLVLWAGLVIGVKGEAG